MEKIGVDEIDRDERGPSSEPLQGAARHDLPLMSESNDHCS